MEKWGRINPAMFLLVSFFLVVFYSAAYFQMSGGAIAAFFAGMAFLLAGLKAVRDTEIACEEYILKQKAEILIAVALSAVATFVISTKFVGPVIAASAVALIYATATKPCTSLNNLSGAVYCGAFVGMSAPIFSLEVVAAAGTLAGIILIASHRVYNHTGGLLGTIAFIAAFTTKIALNIFGG